MVESAESSFACMKLESGYFFRRIFKKTREDGASGIRPARPAEAGGGQRGQVSRFKTCEI